MCSAFSLIFPILNYNLQLHLYKKKMTKTLMKGSKDYYTTHGGIMSKKKNNNQQHRRRDNKLNLKHWNVTLKKNNEGLR